MALGPLAIAGGLVGLLHLFGKRLALSSFRAQACSEDFHDSIPRQLAKSIEDLLSALRTDPDRDQERDDLRLDLLSDVLRGPELQQNPHEEGSVPSLLRSPEPGCGLAEGSSPETLSSRWDSTRRSATLA